MARPPQEVLELARKFVCVRVLDMRPVDLARFRFDFDLTFAAMTLDPRGRVLHRFGARDARDPQSHLSMAALTAFLRGSLEELPTLRRGDPEDTDPPNLGRPTIEALPAFRQRDAEKRIDCVHCHTVNDFEWRDAVERGAWKREQMWVYPDPARIGLEVERDDQQKVARVENGSPGAKAGVKAGDRLLSAQRQPLLTRADLQWVLHGLPFEAAKLQLDVERGGGIERGAGVERGGTRVELVLELPRGWKAAPPLEYAWRSYKWNLPPQPGFGGRLLSADEKEALGLDPAQFAQKVDYLVTWGDKAHTGRNAEKAGLREGDVVLSIAGVSDFATEDHFQAWFRLTQKPGARIDLQILRDGKPRTLKLTVVE